MKLELWQVAAYLVLFFTMVTVSGAVLMDRFRLRRRLEDAERKIAAALEFCAGRGL